MRAHCPHKTFATTKFLKLLYYNSLLGLQPRVIQEYRKKLEALKLSYSRSLAFCPLCTKRCVGSNLVEYWQTAVFEKHGDLITNPINISFLTKFPPRISRTFSSSAQTNTPMAQLDRGSCGLSAILKREESLAPNTEVHGETLATCFAHAPLKVHYEDHLLGASLE